MKRVEAWNLSDEFWRQIEALIPKPQPSAVIKPGRAPGAGRKPVDTRKMLSAVLYVLRKNLFWRDSPSSLGRVPTVHRYFKLWQKAGFFSELRRGGFNHYPELKGLAWDRAEGLRSRSQLAGKPLLPSGSSPSCETRERERSIADSRIQAHLLRLHGTTEASTFWRALQGLFREAIPNDSMIGYLDYFDHPKSWMAAKIYTTANVNMPVEWFERRWKLDITRRFVHCHPGIKLFRFSDIISDPRELRNTDYFRQFFKPFDWHHIVCLPYWRGSEMSSGIALRRTQKQGDFQLGEIELLKKLHPHIDTVLKRLLPAHKEKSTADWLKEFAQHLPLPLLLLDWNLTPVYVNREALQQCAIWNFGTRKARAYDPRTVFQAPPVIIEACADLKVRQLEGNMNAVGAEQRKISISVTHPCISGYSATIVPQANHGDLIAKPGFLIYFDNKETAARPLNAALLRLTSAERELFQLATEGHGNADIAIRLNKSVNTVKHQLTSIYNKLGIIGRGKRLLNLL